MKTTTPIPVRVEVATRPLEVIVSVGDQRLGARITPATARRLAKALLAIAEPTKPSAAPEGRCRPGESLGDLLKRRMREIGPRQRTTFEGLAKVVPTENERLRAEIDRLRRGIEANDEKLGKLIVAAGLTRGTRH